MDSPEASAVWNQWVIPVALRRTGRGERLRIRMPWSDDNRQWLRDGRQAVPHYDRPKRYWEMPRSWFDDFVNRSLERYGQVWIIQPYREQETCSPACRNAKGHECQCSCMGLHHGVGDDRGWFDVSDTFSFRWGDRQLACRLLTRRDHLQT